MTSARAAGRGVLLGLLAAIAADLGVGCGDDCCTIDSFPIALGWAPLGAGAPGRPGGLLAQAQSASLQGGSPFAMSIDTGSPLTVSNGSADGTPETVSRSFDILGASGATLGAPVRARFQGIDMVPVSLGTVGDASTQPQAVMGGDLLRAFSVEFHFGAPSMTFWPNQQADDGFLEDVGYAVLHFTPFGGGEVTANGEADFLGLRGPVNVPPTRIVFRACVTPQPFDPATAPRELCCERGDDVTNALDGAPLSLLLATGVGPLVLSRSAWNRVLPKLQSRPTETPGLLYLSAAVTPLSVGWSTLPAAARLALVNKEATDAADPGPCVELGRSRRIEWVDYQQTLNQQMMSDAPAACVQPCDTDPNEPDKAQNSAAYVEVGAAAGDEIPVAIVDDTEPLFEGLRTDVSPEGPDLDGIIGAGVLKNTRLELDSRSSSLRAIFSCDGNPPRDLCWTSARCPRLPDKNESHACFNLPLTHLPAACADNGCGL